MGVEELSLLGMALIEGGELGIPLKVGPAALPVPPFLVRVGKRPVADTDAEATTVEEAEDPPTPPPPEVGVEAREPVESRAREGVGSTVGDSEGEGEGSGEKEVGRSIVVSVMVLAGAKATSPL